MFFHLYLNVAPTVIIMRFHYVTVSSSSAAVLNHLRLRLFLAAA